ncbi:glycoside hydrolase family 71 protein [Atractiella rhizophila]|nr:glycoside hydrolase family 71 protein [Atractiella rhizophila]
MKRLVTIYIATWLLRPAQAALKDVYAHYMVGSTNADHAVTDVQQAKALNIDAFALNIQWGTDQPWLVTALSNLFNAAVNNNFKLFFSFDMATQGNLDVYLPFFRQYVSSSAYHRHSNLPIISTFWGSGLGNDYYANNLRQTLKNEGYGDVYFLPAFSDYSGGPSGFWNAFPTVDGIFNWEAWPTVDQGNVNVSSAVDQQWLNGARSAGKTFMMGLSTVQFKHIDGGQNWYRYFFSSIFRELNYGLRLGQILALQPDFVEIITWNDAGESHYFGNVWPESIAGSVIGQYTDGYPHDGWQAVLSSFITAYKAGSTSTSSLVPTTSASVVGTFWYRPLLRSATCNGDSLGKPSGWQNAEDTINIAILVAQNAVGGTVNVFSGGAQIASYSGAKLGLNAYAVPGVRTGAVRVQFLNSAGASIIDVSGARDVVADSSYCNFNYQVVGI